jgi:nucleoid-associated protein YgaU
LNSSSRGQPVLRKIQQEGAELQNLNLDGNQLYLKATADSEASKNRIWDGTKAVDPNFADLKHDIEVRQGEQSYTVQPGHNLSKISKHFYGDANKYSAIAKANNLASDFGPGFGPGLLRSGLMRSPEILSPWPVSSGKPSPPQR